jgi:signal recognition particle subunit SRP54
MENLMGPVDTSIDFKDDGVTIIKLAGLQGSGKTTTAGKLALHLRDKYDCSPMMVAADVRRPAAIDQLEKLGREIDVPVVSDRDASAPMVCTQAKVQAVQQNCNPLILDTAGRLHIDEEMMDELQRIRDSVEPDYTFLVVDAMTGQDAVVSAKEFDKQLGYDAAILTKLDGDARGGAALSIKAVTGKPVKFAGVGEQLDKFEEFHPDRMADRILGMGDVVTLVEKAEEAVEEEDAKELEEKLKNATFDLEDFRKQIETMRKMGPLQEILGYLPGMGNQMQDLDIDESQIDRIEGIINSMTPRERTRPAIINASRRKRIAEGSGTEPKEVNRLLKQFKQMRKMMKKVSKGNMGALEDMMPEGMEGQMEDMMGQ